ncbi:olfactory receptor family 52 subfamily N member 2 [Phyllostomus discolor]|uniref:Olfactory receptor n=1 Tax=Phyllostomus discolor TaxID=89673 RepID=A0A6J2M4C8_9CHIR|nr:olfactory receptor 52N2 [Phyllostomus discolor]KAF6105276.1 olfactory receptor family 52 subfamily N member 2 [Phyllostomus discolor]
MYGANSSSLTPKFFVLNGVPGLENAHIWISLPFCFMYILAVLGNCGLIYLISHEEALHRPMYYFLALLSFTDVTLCTTTVPNMLCIFWFNLKEIDFNACLAQMFFVHTLTATESGVLMLMALDRYVAICYPLRYSTIFTNAVIAKAGLATFLRSVTFIIPFTFLTKRLPYCHGNFIPHTYCDHMSVAKVSCGNFKINAIYGLMVALLICVFDICCISVSYTMILRAVVSLSSADARHKAFSTCTSHICAIVITYVPAFFTFFTHRFGGHHIPQHIHIIVANLYLLLPPTMNPIVYGVKTKQIREGVIKFLLGDKVVLNQDK